MVDFRLYSILKLLDCNRYSMYDFKLFSDLISLLLSSYSKKTVNKQEHAGPRWWKLDSWTSGSMQKDRLLNWAHAAWSALCKPVDRLWLTRLWLLITSSLDAGATMDSSITQAIWRAIGWVVFALGEPAPNTCTIVKFKNLTKLFFGFVLDVTNLPSNDKIAGL